MRKINNLFTEEYQENNNFPLEEYPRQQFKRNSYFSLNGLWNYEISKNKNSRNYQGQILVPYPIQSINSRVNKTLKKNEYIIYQKKFTLEKNFIKDYTILNILGIDQEFTIYLNNTLLGEYTFFGVPMQIDISKCVKEENEIIIIVKDNLNLAFPHGKQSNNPKGMFYTQVSGIYYPIFIESYHQKHIGSFKYVSNLSSVDLYISCNEDYHIEIYENEKLLYKIASNKEHLTINFDNPHIWSCEDPFLYKLIITSAHDKIESYFALRTIELKDNFVYLNKKKIFLNGLLDQGYYPEGIFTVSSYKSYEKDILTMKELGFNLLRKHIKVEIDYFYYLCDKYGMLVMQDFVNNGKYRFIHDTVLPTIGFQSLKDHKVNFYQQQCFIEHGKKLVKYLFNHPCVIAYTIFNEGWGQQEADKMYDFFKEYDSTRLYDATSGWFKQTRSDFNSKHIYFKKINLSKENSPVLLSEFGGYSYKVENHIFNLKNNYGYKFFKKQNEFQDAFIQLYLEQIISNKDKLVGAIYTQVSDVEDETNGLFTYDRKVLKVDIEKIKSLMKKLLD